MLDNFWGHFGDHFGTRSAQEGAKLGPRGPLRASKTKTPAFAKTLKTHSLFEVFGVQRPPRRALGSPRRPPRGAQRAPKPQQIGSKNGPRNYKFMDPFWAHFGFHFGTNNYSKKGPKMGQKIEAILEPFWACLGAVFGSRVRARAQPGSEPGPWRGKGRAAKLIYSAYLAYLAA